MTIACNANGDTYLALRNNCSIALLFPEEAERARVMGHVLGGIAVGVLIGLFVRFVSIWSKRVIP